MITLNSILQFLAYRLFKFCQIYSRVTSRFIYFGATVNFKKFDFQLYITFIQEYNRLLCVGCIFCDLVKLTCQLQFLVDNLGIFYVNNHVFCKQRWFYSFESCMFLSFSYLITLAKTFSTMMYMSAIFQAVQFCFCSFSVQIEKVSCFFFFFFSEFQKILNGY